MISLNPEKLARTIRTLRIFIDRSLDLEDKNIRVTGFTLNPVLLEASAYNTYIETISDKADRLYDRIKETHVDMMVWSYLDAIKAISGRFVFSQKPLMLAFDYTDEEFYGNVQGFEIHGVKRDGAITGAFKFLTCSIISDEIPQKIPLISVPIYLGHSMTKEVCYCLTLLKKVIGPITLILFDRGYYSKELMYTLTAAGYPYLIFIPKNEQVKTELESMNKNEQKIISYEFEFRDDKNAVKGQTYQAFLKQIFCKRLEKDLDWAFATNAENIELEGIIKTYKKRWRIETGFRVQDEAEIRCKSKEMNIRFFLFLYEQLLQTLWICFFKEEVNFKGFIIEMSKTSNKLVEKENKNTSVSSKAIR